MTERYWNVGEVPVALEDWVSSNVAEAIRYFWEDDPPVVWIGDDLEKTSGRLVLTVGGPGKATAEDPAGGLDIYSLDVDLLGEITEWSKPYADIGGPRSDEQRDDMRERAATLRKFAELIVGLADAADMTANDEAHRRDAAGGQSGGADCSAS